MVGTALLTVCAVIALYAALPASAFAVGPVRRVPWATLVALLVVGIPSLVQLTVAPELLGDLERNWTLIAAGQWWRPVTSLVVQDGGVAGTVYNLVALVIVGGVAEQVWDRRRWVVIALVAGIGAQFWGAVVQPVGGGNSVAVFGLAAATALTGVWRGSGAARATGAIGLAAGLVLLVSGDIHGGACVLGVLAAVLLRPPRRRAADDGLALGTRAGHPS